MKRLVISLIALLFMGAVNETTYKYIGLNKAASSNDKQSVRAKIQSLLKDNKPVDATQLPQWANATTSRVYWVLSIDDERRHSLLPSRNISLHDFNVWKTNNMENPNHLQLLSGTSTQVLGQAGLHLVKTWDDPPEN